MRLPKLFGVDNNMLAQSAHPKMTLFVCTFFGFRSPRSAQVKCLYTHNTCHFLAIGNDIFGRFSDQKFALRTRQNRRKLLKQNDLCGRACEARARGERFEGINVRVGRGEAEVVRLCARTLAMLKFYFNSRRKTC